MADNYQSVADLMTTEFVTCPGEATMGEMALKFARGRVHAVVVVDERGRPTGIVSDFDLLAGPWLADDAQSIELMRKMTAAELMTSPLETISATATAADAAARLRKLRLNHLLVTDEAGTAQGMISVTDLVEPFGHPAGEANTVRDVMSYAIVTCPPSTPLSSAARAMTERRSRSVVVVDDAGRAAGIVTNFDLLSLYENDRREAPVSELMRTPLISADPDMSLSDAADLMISEEVHRLVIVDSAGEGGAPIGIVSTSDVVAAMIQESSVWQRSDG
ncbi:MAG: CBS domain-containing protein [Solirubrobacteraceae bacterium]